MTNLSYKYNAPMWFQVLQILVYVSCIIVAAVQQGACPVVPALQLGLDVWLLVIGISGLLYALLPYLLIGLAIPCVCLLPCLLPLLVVAMVMKLPYFIAWFAIGITIICMLSSTVTLCPLVFAFSIVALTFTPVDLFLTFQYTKMDDNE